MVKKTVAFFAALLVTGYCSLVSVSSQHEAAVAANFITGDLVVLEPGLNLTAPWVFVANIDTRSRKLCIPSVAQTLTCRLVQFKANGAIAFVKREGFRYYWWDNRISFNAGHAEQYRGISDVLMGYAFTTAEYPFLERLAQ